MTSSLHWIGTHSCRLVQHHGDERLLAGGVARDGNTPEKRAIQKSGFQ
jgi:hypothetical protein